MSSKNLFHATSSWMRKMWSVLDPSGQEAVAEQYLVFLILFSLPLLLTSFSKVNVIDGVKLM